MLSATKPAESPSARLIEFLEEQWAERGAQMRFARESGCSDSVTSKWKSGQPPDLTGCLKIAMYYKVDPYDVFEWAGRPDYGVLAHSLGIAGGRPRPVWELYRDEDHQRLHRMLDELLEIDLAHNVAEVIELEHARTVGALHKGCRFLIEQTGAEACAVLTDEGKLLGFGGEVGRRELEALQEGDRPKGWKHHDGRGLRISLRAARPRTTNAVTVEVVQQVLWATLGSKGFGVTEKYTWKGRGKG